MDVVWHIPSLQNCAIPYPVCGSLYPSMIWPIPTLLKYADCVGCVLSTWSLVMRCPAYWVMMGLLFVFGVLYVMAEVAYRPLRR